MPVMATGLDQFPELESAIGLQSNGLLTIEKSSVGPYVRLQASGPSKSDSRKMCVTHVLVTANPDGQGDIVEPDGGLFDVHRKHPIVLLDHGINYKLPVAKAKDGSGNYTVRKSGGKVTAKTYFSAKDRMSDQLFGLVDEGLISGWSAGFKPIKGEVEVLSAPMLKSHRGSYRFRRWQLFEYSLTPTPVNPEALTIKIEKSLASYDPQIIERLRPYLLQGNRSTVVVPNHELVSKSMNENVAGGAMSEDMSSGTEKPKSPAVMAAYTLAQGLSDVCGAADSMIEQSDNPKFKKMLRKLCEEADKLAAKSQAMAAKMESALGGDGDMEEDENPDDGKQKSLYGDEDDQETPDLDDENRVVTKSGWRPERFVLKSNVSYAGVPEGCEIVKSEDLLVFKCLIDDNKRLRQAVKNLNAR